MNDILNICAVHPMREVAMRELMKKDHVDSSLIESMIQKKQIHKLDYGSKTFQLDMEVVVKMNEKVEGNLTVIALLNHHQYGTV